FAFPELVRTGTPATIFLVSDLIGTNSSFWPNRLARLVIHFGVKARTEPSLAWLRNAGALPADFDGAREQTSRVIAGCKRLSDREIAYELDKSESASGLAPPEGPELLDWDQIVEMRDTRLIEFGSHTCTHMRLNESASTDD